MSSYEAERKLGYEEGLEAGRIIANQMMQDGYEKGLKDFRSFDDQNSTVYYHLTKVFEYLGVKNDKLVNTYKQYIIEECKSING